MSLTGKRNGDGAVAGPSRKRVRIDAADDDEPDYFDGDPDLDDAPRTRRQRKTRITGQDMGEDSSSSEGESETEEPTSKVLDELEAGQEVGTVADGDEELEDSSQSEEEQEIDINAAGERTPPPPDERRRLKATEPKLTSFNMDEEMKTGQFDADGNYHQHDRDPQAQHDAWLSGVYSKTKIRSAREAHEKRLREAREKEQKAAQQDDDEDELRKELTEHMQRGETVQRTLQRLGKKKEAKQLDTVTHIASVLMSRFGELDIYGETYETLLKAVHKSGLVRQTFDPASRFDVTETQWEYKWSPAYLAALTDTPVASDVEVFGPFSCSDLKAWAEAGYFGPDHSHILLRPALSTNPWIPYSDALQ